MKGVQQIESNCAVKLGDDHSLWRYISLPTLFSYLHGKVFIPSLKKLREMDPFEAEFPTGLAWFNKALREFTGDDHQAVVKFIREELCTPAQRQRIELHKLGHHADMAWSIYEEQFWSWIRRTRFAWCWFQSSRESALMWNTYGMGGAAVMTTLGKLKKLLSQSKLEFIFSPMVPIDLSPQLSVKPFDPQKYERFLIRPYFFKRREYIGEQEVRFVTAGPEQPGKSGIALTFEDAKPEDWIQRIRLHPKMLRDDEVSVSNAVKCLAPGISCRRSDLLSPRKTKAAAEAAEQLAGSSQSTWLLGNDGIPGAIKKL